jgi:4-hydroxyphenylpyruvate dioxygenase-like putative hemolysin
MTRLIIGARQRPPPHFVLPVLTYSIHIHSRQSVAIHVRLSYETWHQSTSHDNTTQKSKRHRHLTTIDHLPDSSMSRQVPLYQLFYDQFVIYHALTL